MSHVHICDESADDPARELTCERRLEIGHRFDHYDCIQKGLIRAEDLANGTTVVFPSDKIAAQARIGNFLS